MDKSESRPASLSRSEWIAMNAVWEHCRAQQDITVSELLPQIRARKPWTVSTLKTVLERLARKGALKSIVRGRTCFYSPRADRDTLVRGSLGEVLDTMLEDAFGPLVAYLADRRKLSESEIADLHRILSTRNSSQE
jgi:predicted transcriptional regulator